MLFQNRTYVEQASSALLASKLIELDSELSIRF